MSEKRKLKKELGVFSATSVVVGCVIGAGVFFKPYAIYQATGGAPGMGMLAWIVGGLASIFAALTFAEVAVLIPKTGGMVAYLGEVFGERIGFLAGWIVCIRGQIDTLPGRCGRRIRCLRGGAAACTSSDERQGQKQCRKKPQVYRFNRFHRGKSPFCKRRSPPRGTAIPTLYSICRENTT